MTHKFYQLPIDTVFHTPEQPEAFEQFKKISDTRAVRRIYPLEWGKAQFQFRRDAEVVPLNAPPVYEWEEFHIEITSDASENLGKHDERFEITERFESELFRLVKKYQGQAGLTFYARSSMGEIVE